jgi:hypothetical protein
MVFSRTLDKILSWYTDEADNTEFPSKNGKASVSSVKSVYKNRSGWFLRKPWSENLDRSF